MRARSFGGGGGPAALSVEYVVVAGGAGSMYTGSSFFNFVTGGGGAGGYRSSVTGESSGGGAAAETPFVPLLGYAYPLAVGAGGSTSASDSSLGIIISKRGGAGGQAGGGLGGSGGGGSARVNLGGDAVTLGGSGTAEQGFDGGDGGAASNLQVSGGGGGASEAGEDGVAGVKGGDGGDGLTTNITGTPIALAGGGGGSDLRYTGVGVAVKGLGGLGGGADGSEFTGTSDPITRTGANGTANTGGGGGGNLSRNAQSGSSVGGSGRILFKVESKYDPDITITPGVVYTTTTVGDYTVYDVTAGGSTDRITFGTQTDFAWSLANPSYSGDRLDLTGQTTTTIGLVFNSDGTKLWVTGYGDETIYEYTMSTPYDVANATYTGTNKVLSAGSFLRSFRWKTDGTKLYAVYNTTAGTIYEYTASVPFDITSLTSSTSHSFLNLIIYDFDISSDGTKVITIDNGDRFREFTLSTPWQLNTEGQNFSYLASSIDSNMAGVKWKPDGTRLYSTGTSGDKVYEFLCPTPYSVSGMFLANEYYVGTQAGLPYGLAFKPDGTEMFVSNYSGFVYKYDLIP